MVQSKRIEVSGAISRTLSEMFDQARDKGYIEIQAKEYVISRTLLAAFEQVYRKIAKHNLSNNLKKRDYYFPMNTLVLRDVQTQVILLKVCCSEDIYTEYHDINSGELELIKYIVEALISYQNHRIRETSNVPNEMVNQAIPSKRIERVLSIGNIFWSANETLNQMRYQATHWGFIDISAAIYYVPRNLIYRLMHEFYVITGYHLNINISMDDHKRTIFQIFLKELECTLITIQDIDPTSEQFIIPCSIDGDREEKIKQVITVLTKHLDCAEQRMSKVPLIQRIINFFKRRF